jgi:hypothetical protein
MRRLGQVLVGRVWGTGPRPCPGQTTDGVLMRFAGAGDVSEGLSLGHVPKGQEGR